MLKTRHNTQKATAWFALAASFNLKLCVNMLNYVLHICFCHLRSNEKEAKLE